MRSDERQRWRNLLEDEWARYPLTVATVVFAALVREALDPLLGGAAPFHVFYIATLLASAVGGPVPGLLATALGGILGTLLFVEPRSALSLAPAGDGLRLLLFLIAGVAISLVAGRLRVGRGKAEEQAKAAERALRESERRFRGTFENAAVGIGHIALDGRFLRVNETFREMLGRSADELRGARFGDLTHPDDRAADAARFEEMVRGDRESDIVEKRYLRPDGTAMWVLVTRSLQRDDAGRPAYAISVIQDITDRRRTEDALRRSEAFAQRIIASSLSGLYIFDVGRASIVYVSPQYTRITGYALDDISGIRGPGLLELFHPEDRERVRAHVAAAADAGDDEVREIEYRFKTAEGRWIWCLSRETVFARNPDGSVAQYLGSFLDVTERKQIEEALRESESFYRQTLESIPGMVFTTRPDGYCDYQSRQWVAYTGVPMREHLGDGWNKLLHPDDRSRAYATWKASVERGSRYDLEYRVRRRDGQYEWFKVVGEPIRDAAGHIVRWFGIALNVEDLKRAEAALEAARHAAEEASRAKDRFLAVLSHELRTPLTPAVAALSILKNTRGLDASTRESLEIIRRNVEMEARLIDDLLDVTRIVRGKVELDRRLVPLGDVIKRAVEVCTPDLEARRLHFGVDLGSCGPCPIHGDPARLQQVFWNLLQNAIKFTPHGGCVGIRCRLEDHSVIAEVVDSGEGIDPAVLPHIFNPFEQGGSGVTRQFGGLGLGLTITKGFVEMHGGDISAHSGGSGTGATFRVRLPIHVCDEAALAAGELAGTGTGTKAGTGAAPPLRILLVEDHGDTAMMMQLLLTAEGHEVETAGDVATAVKLAEATRFDLLVSDLGLPDGSGVDLMRSLRQRGNVVPGIALSGFGQEEDVRRSREAGFSAHLIKPASPDRLIEVIATVTAGKAA